jgi:hypothetical protein
MSEIESQLTAPPWADYDLDNPATWTTMEAPAVEKAWEEALTKIGGLNPFGKPMLVWRWGATYRDPMKVDNSLKYMIGCKEGQLVGFEFHDPITGLDMTVKTMAEVPPTVLVAVPVYEREQLGERRIIIEHWRSPGDLARQGRYRANMLRDPGKTYEFFFCKACDAQLMVGQDGPQPCLQCGSKRSYLRDVRIAGEGQLLRSLPHEGAYDFFVRLENQLSEPLPADANTLRQIESAWYNYHHLSDQEQDAIIDRMMAQQAQTNAAADNPANPFMAPGVPEWRES